MREAVLTKAWEQLYGSNDHLLFGSRKTNVDLSTLHPEQVQIFRLWQIYLENINPLLKVTHTPTLQARIIDAASDVTNISPTLEALMFSIYCVSILSLIEDECHTIFGSPREDLLTSYQFGCQQALQNCGVLRTNDRECLTALYLYLVSLSGRHLLLFASNASRSRLDPTRTPGLYPRCLALPSALRSVWAFISSRPMPNTVLSRLRCAEDFGGR